MRKRSWSVRVAAPALAVGLVTASLATAPAHAGPAVPPAFQVVQNTSLDSPTDKVIGVRCPTGTKVYSTGGRVSSNIVPGQVVIDRMEPTPGLTGAVVSARARSADGPSWNVTAYAVCGTGNPTLQAIGTNTVKRESATASCPNGTLTGVSGGAIGGVNGQQSLVRLEPDQVLKTGTVGVSGPDDDSWSPKASVICDSALNNAERFEQPANGGQQGTVASNTLTCPRGTLIGGGGAINSQPHADDALLGVALQNNSVTVTGTAGASPWSITAYAICV